MSSLGDYLKDKRRERHLSLRDVERITEGKVSNGYLSQIESGQVKNPSLSKLHLIAAAMGLGFNELAEIAIGERPYATCFCPTCGQPL